MSHDTWHATEVLLAAAREYGSVNARYARSGSVVAAAYRLAATRLRERGLVDAAGDLERCAARAEQETGS